MTATLRERIDAVIDRRLTADEVRSALTDPISAAERENVLSLVHWFRTRYPTPLERLAYVRRAYARWNRRATTSGLPASAPSLTEADERTSEAAPRTSEHVPDGPR